MDKIQEALHQQFSTESWLSRKQNMQRLMDWTTFYRRNIPAFIEHYFGITIYPFQIIMSQEAVGRSFVVVVASRGSSKSWWAELYACAICVLYPGSMVVIIAPTKKQAGLLITKKLVELMKISPNLSREIKKTISNTNDIGADFKNGSTMVVVPASENALGNRSTVLILEEFRRMKKDIVDRIARPFQMARPTPFRKKEMYANLIEEPTTVYISSSGTTSEWIWDTCKEAIASKFKDDSGCLLAMDVSIPLKHGLKTKRTILQDKHTFDPITFRIEYLNEMLRENQHAFFSYASLLKIQTQKRAFYPRKHEDVRMHKKNLYDIPKQPDEIRILSCDIAFVDKKDNDNSVFSCIRLIPETSQIENAASSASMQKGYRRIVSYLEAEKGKDIDLQAIRIKQLFEDFGADYCVLDLRNGGILVQDRLAKVLYDVERDKEYPAWQCFNDEETANRVKVSGALPVMFGVTASAKLNSDMALVMRDVLISSRLEILIPHNVAVDDLLSQIPDYCGARDADTMLFYERPYLETQALISEMIALEYEVGTQTNVFKIFETGKNTKDRYSSVAMGNYFASLLEQDLLSENSAYESCVFIN